MCFSALETHISSWHGQEACCVEPPNPVTDERDSSDQQLIRDITRRIDAIEARTSENLTLTRAILRPAAAGAATGVAATDVAASSTIEMHAPAVSARTPVDRSSPKLDRENGPSPLPAMAAAAPSGRHEAEEDRVGVARLLVSGPLPRMQSQESAIC